jgi:hypothetical protein
MAISVERPSRTAGELVSEGVRGTIKGSVKLFLWGMAALFLAAGVQNYLRTVLASPELSGWLGLLSGLLLLGLRYRRQITWTVRQAKRLKGAGNGATANVQEAEGTSGSVADASDTVLGRVVDEGQETGKVLCLSPELRNRHIYMIGKTRMGKTTLLKSIVQQDMRRGDGVCFLDPHGDAAEELLGLIPPDRIGDVLYFDPTRKDAPAFNPLALPFSPPKLTEDVISVFGMLLGDSWGPRMEHLLRFGVLTLLVDSTPRTLRDLRRLYLDEDFREEVLANVENEQIREFWESEYPMMPKGAASPILNKLSAFLAPMSDLDRVFSQNENSLDFSEILSERKILIVNLAKGKLGEEPARLLGGLLVTGLQQAALARTAIAPEERWPFALTVDEFQNFTVASFESILAESAKYRVNLTLANQNLGQLSSSLERAIFGNCGTVVAFQVSADDASRLQREMHRSRIVVRRRESQEFQPVEEFLAERREILREALQDKYLGMDAAERRKQREMEKLAYHGTGSMAGAVVGGLAIGRMKSNRRAEIERMLATLESDDPLDVRTVAELFPDFEVRELSFPAASDLTGIPPRHAFCRVGQSDLVVVIRCLPSMEPDPETREAVEAELALLAPMEQPTEPRASKRRPPSEPAPIDSLDFRE